MTNAIDLEELKVKGSLGSRQGACKQGRSRKLLVDNYSIADEIDKKVGFGYTLRRLAKNSRQRSQFG